MVVQRLDGAQVRAASSGGVGFRAPTRDFILGMVAGEPTPATAAVATMAEEAGMAVALEVAATTIVAAHRVIADVTSMAQAGLGMAIISMVVTMVRCRAKLQRCRTLGLGRCRMVTCPSAFRRKLRPCCNRPSRHKLGRSTVKQLARPSTFQHIAASLLQQALAAMQDNNEVPQSSEQAASKKGNGKPPYCTRCYTKGHTLQEECKDEMYCEICDCTSHMTTRCPKYRGDKPSAVPVGYAVEGLGFFLIPNSVTQALRNDSRNALIRITDGVLTVPDVISELERLIPGRWRWHAEDLGQNTFKTLFPSRAELQRMVEWGIVQTKIQNAKLQIDERNIPSEVKYVLPKTATGAPPPGASRSTEPQGRQVYRITADGSATQVFLPQLPPNANGVRALSTLLAATPMTGQVAAQPLSADATSTLAPQLEVPVADLQSQAGAHVEAEADARMEDKQQVQQTQHSDSLDSAAIDRDMEQIARDCNMESEGESKYHPTAGAVGGNT
ncbi:hypothetical protein EJB05_09669, partial [Eragrostis curvula]